jgi:hypothetical protein
MVGIAKGMIWWYLPAVYELPSNSLFTDELLLLSANLVGRRRGRE